MIALPGDPAVPDEGTLVRRLADPDGMFGIPREAIPNVLLRGTAAELAAQLAAFGEAGAERVVISVAAGSWQRQTELVAEARRLLD